MHSMRGWRCRSSQYAAQREALEVGLGKIICIEPVYDFAAPPGMTPDHCPMDGYSVQTDQHQFLVLIENEQSCCESFGIITSEDDHTPFIGSELREVLLTDRALNQKRVEDSGYYEDDGGIQFVDFRTSRGVFQLSVYNAHNGYYGHRILVLKDADVLLSEIL